MLTKVKTGGRSRGGTYVIVASEYNARYVNAMLKAAAAELKRAGASVEIIRVPGAYEIPVTAAQVARRSAVSGIVCLGVILRGETAHAGHIGDSVSHALMQIQVQQGVPIIHEVLLLESEEQARVRCLGKTHNRGAEAAHTALKMARVMRKIGKG